jgi:hypothetical protein
MVWGNEKNQCSVCLYMKKVKPCKYCWKKGGGEVGSKGI